MNVLVVDDEPIIHESLKRTLTREGFCVDATLSAQEGLAQLTKGSYELIITDLMMPEMDGLEFLRELKRASCNIPTIMITGYPTIRTALQALRLGAVDYIPKPFTRKELLSPVQRALRGRELEAQEASNAEGDLLSLEQKNSLNESEEKEPGDGSLMPGDRFCLPRHSWGVYDQDGTVFIGVEASCLKAVRTVASVMLPAENDLVEQGYPGVRLKTQNGEEHNIFVPVSGRVVKINQEVVDNISLLGPEIWLLQVIPSLLQEELPFLQRSS